MSNHPMQPVVLVDGVPRFKQNAIVRFLLDEGPFNLDALSRLHFTPEDYTHLMQLLGTSVSAYGDLPGSPPEMVEKVDLWAEECHTQAKLGAAMEAALARYDELIALAEARIAEATP